MKSLSRFLGLAAAAALAASCGQSPELVDRTQPNYLRKADLLSGTWYMQDTVVDVPSTSPIAVIGYSGALEKVRFEIQEDYLVAYRTYEFLPGSDPLVDQSQSSIGSTRMLDGSAYKGAPVAAWPIQSHFDRQRQYNASTGEQSNVLVEDTQDRPWYQREFIRVNWASNVINNFQMMTGGLAAPVQSYVTPIDQNVGDGAFTLSYSEVNGKQQLDYFDYTIRAYFDPPKVYYPGYGAIPYCWLNPKVDCESAEVKIRNSIRRIDEAKVVDYEPLPYGDKLATKFGYFRTDRVTYDRNRGVTESGRITYANRHNIWERSRDASGLSIPVQERQPKPVVYYLSSNWPANLMDAAKEIERSWDAAFRRAVAVPRGLEVADVPQMFYVCPTPVPDDAPEACGPRGLNVRLGDLRYNQLPWIDQDQLSGPLGLGPSAADPETGEIIQGVANLYGSGVDRLAASVQQWVDVLNGDLAIEDLIAGKDAQSYVFDNLNPTDPRRPASGPWSSSGGLTGEAQRPLGSFASLTGQLKTKIESFKVKGHLPLFNQDRRKLVDQLISANPVLESELINAPEVRAMVLASAPSAEFRQKLQNDASFYRQVARQSMLLTGELRKLHKEREEWASRFKGNGCLYLAEFADDVVMGLATQMKDRTSKRVAELTAEGKDAATAKRLAREEVYQEIRHGITVHIGAHEVGHTLGLTHNFIGSFDAMNYHDGYWDLRKQTIGVMVGGKRVLPTTPQNLADAYKKNQAQIDGRMGDLQYSSIMDYGARMYSDKGIGKYDAAAILFAYSGGGEPGYVEVFRETRGKSADDYDDNADLSRPGGGPNLAVPTDNLAKAMLVRGAHTEVPLAHVRHYTPVSEFYSDKFHYTTLPFHFADKQPVADFNFEAALDQGISRMQSRTYRRWSEMEALYEKVEQAYHEYQLDQGGWSKADWDESSAVITKAGIHMPVEVPYMYCSDYEVGANIACNRWDYGADIYEMTRDWMDRYQQYYAFNAFKRDRLSFDANTYLNQIEGRYLANLPNVYQQWLFSIFWTQFYYGLTTEQMEQFVGVGDPIYQNYWTMAVVDSTNTLMQVLATPSVGYHGKRADGSWEHLATNSPSNARLPTAAENDYIQQTLAQGYQDVVYVPRGSGRSMYTLYDGQGYDFFTRANEMGHFWDQVVAMGALTTSQTNFLGVDRGADALRYSLPYYMTFSRELSNLFGSVWSERRGDYAGSLVKTGNGLATYVPPTYVRAEDYVLGFKYPLEAPVLVNGSPVPVEKVEATPTWSTRFYAQVWGMAYFSENFNQEYPSMNQVFLLGSGENIDPGPGYSVVQFQHGSYVLAALKPNNATKLPPAPYLIEQANANAAAAAAAKVALDGKHQGLTEAQWNAKVQDNVRSLEMMRGLYNIFGQAL